MIIILRLFVLRVPYRHHTSSLFGWKMYKISVYENSCLHKDISFLVACLDNTRTTSTNSQHKPQTLVSDNTSFWITLCFEPETLRWAVHPQVANHPSPPTSYRTCKAFALLAPQDPQAQAVANIIGDVPYICEGFSLKMGKES